MAKSLAPTTWQNGFAQPVKWARWCEENYNNTESGTQSHYNYPPSEEPLSSTVHNALGLNVLRTWPTLYNGTETPHDIPDWWQPSKEVDVLICGAGAFGLEVALSLARQGVTFRIIDKAEAPLLAGRADAIQPRSLEILHSWGLAQEVHEEGPLLDHTALYKNGEKLLYGRTFQSDSRYRGLHVITQGQMERIYVRDLLRHRVLVERRAIVDEFTVEEDQSIVYPVRATVKNIKTGKKETIHAKFLVGADGAASAIRKQLKVPFDGTSTDIYWAIIDCVFDTDYPYITTFGVFINDEHGGCIIVPREDGYTRIYTQISAEKANRLAQNRQPNLTSSALGESGGKVESHSITAEEVLEQTNKIFTPYTLRFAAPISWFAVWKISERVARYFSSPDLRVHLGGDAAHVHSVLGAFGLNSSIYDASNLGWKLGLCALDRGKISSLLPTYDSERRLFANRVIRVSGTYLRFICNSNLPLAELRGMGNELESHDEGLPTLRGSREADMDFLHAFFKRNATFLLGIEWPRPPSVLCPPMQDHPSHRPITIFHGARAPNPRVCFNQETTGYLYDVLTGPSKFHILIFGSDLRGPVRSRIALFSHQALSPTGIIARLGGRALFNVVLILKALPFETPQLLLPEPDEEPDTLKPLGECATVVYDDRPPDQDAHYCYGINHARGAVAVVRPDLWVGLGAWPEDVSAVERYLQGFLLERGAGP